jgi:hypothetical protein
MLHAVAQNNTTDDIQHAVVAFAAWDKNGLPLKLKLLSPMKHLTGKVGESLLSRLLQSI